MTPWAKMKARYVPTDRELLARAQELAAGPAGTAQWANATRDVTAIRERAARGRHDGSLPELGHYRPGRFVPEVQS